ncbi:hypothetical protein Mcup_1207 [Metallosphaera cuprina Ar-4]|uniref:Uncharacterized protein n=1 Tax=Metallosphaera cuprina (strain Ar-4) TaxID=1006006 RepID=F4G3E2_METCR|nr:hypothetical protein Mcup_1207 [Metallosphaera cuprina Ar-4]
MYDPLSVDLEFRGVKEWKGRTRRDVFSLMCSERSGSRS